MKSNQEFSDLSDPELKDFAKLLSQSDWEAIRQDIRHLQKPRPRSQVWWGWVLSLFKGPMEQSLIPADWGPHRIANLLLASKRVDWPSLLSKLYEGPADEVLPRVSKTFRYLGNMPLQAARDARCALFALFPFDSHPKYEAFLIQEMFAESPEDREELRACFSALAPIKRLRLVRLLDDEQLGCLLSDIEELLDSLDHESRRSWLRRQAPEKADQFLDRLSSLWRRRSDLFEQILLDMPDSSLEHFLETAQKRYRVEELSPDLDPGARSLHRLAFDALGKQVLQGLGNGRLQHEQALSLLSLIPTEHLEHSMQSISEEEGRLAYRHIDALRSHLHLEDHDYRPLDAAVVDERLKTIQSKISLQPPEFGQSS